MNFTGLPGLSFRFGTEVILFVSGRWGLVKSRVRSILSGSFDFHNVFLTSLIGFLSIQK